MTGKHKVYLGQKEYVYLMSDIKRQGSIDKTSCISRIMKKEKQAYGCKDYF